MVVIKGTACHWEWICMSRELTKSSVDCESDMEGGVKRTVFCKGSYASYHVF